MWKNRYRRITWFFARIIVQIIFFDLILIRLGLKKYVIRSRSNRYRKYASQYRSLAVDLGGVLIKVGQFLSSRVDVLPEAITDELSGLQDEVPPESFEKIQLVAEKDLGIKLSAAFSYINPQPIASASLGQVHQARINPIPHIDQTNFNESTLPNEAELFPVVVKIQRPNIEEILSIDLRAMRTVGSWIKLYRPIQRRADVQALINEFTRVLYEEIDYLNEGKNIEIFARNFKDNNKLRVPKVVWSHTTRKVLTMEDVGGIKIDHYDEISAAGISRHEVAVDVLNVYFKQIFEDGFFHADPHPGNLFIRFDPRDGDMPNWQIAFIDFGMVGRISTEMKEGLRETLIAFATRDSDRLVKAYQKLDILLPEANLDLIHQADERAFDLFWGKNMLELRDTSPEEIRKYMIEFRGLIYDLPFQVPHDLIFLARAIGILSGLCTGLDPEFNVWEQIIPYTKRLLPIGENKLEFENLAKEFEKRLLEFGHVLRRILTLPELTYTIMTQIEKGNLIVRNPNLEDLIRNLIRTERKLLLAVLFMTFFFSSVQLYINKSITLSYAFGVVALGILFWIILVIKD